MAKMRDTKYATEQRTSRVGDRRDPVRSRSSPLKTAQDSRKDALMSLRGLLVNRREDAGSSGRSS